MDRPEISNLASAHEVMMKPFKQAAKRIAVWSLSMTISFFAVPCRADLYTAGAASLEWKVDSADEVFLATVVEDSSAKFGLRFEPTETLKAGRSLSSFPHATVHRCRLGRFLDPKYRVPARGTKWLVFVRGEDDSARISNAICLTHPRADWVTAAITATGNGDERVLELSEQIIEEVKARIDLNMTLPKDCDPDLTDQLIVPGTNAPLARWLGGKIFNVDINVWDSDNGYGIDFDTLVDRLLVPLDIPQAATQREWSLKTLTDIETVGMSEATAMAFKNAKPETNQSRLVGTWKAELKDHFLTITIQPRQTLLYLIEPKPGHDLPPLPGNRAHGFGAGFWQTFGDSLRLNANRYVQDRWGRTKQWMRGGARLTRGEVVSIATTHFRFADGRTFVRQAESLRVYDHPHEHPWYLVSEGWGKFRGSTFVAVTMQEPGSSDAQPCENLILMWDARRSALPPGPTRRDWPKTVRIMLGDRGFDPQVAVLLAGDTLEIEATGNRPALDHNINISWFHNRVRGTRDQLEMPLIYRRMVEQAEPTLSPIKCNIHDDEVGHVIVVEYESVSVTDEKGSAYLNDWPLGKQTIRLLHPEWDLRTASVWWNGEKIENSRGRIQLDLHPGNDELKIEIGKPRQ